RPAMTAERFIPDPYSAAPGAVLYRTGDRARWRGDAALEYLGRADHQLKIRGYRVEPGEVEAVLARHPAVREVAVAARGEGAARQLVAYVVPATSGEFPEGELRAAAGEELPEYMVPSLFQTLDALPLTATGKVDRTALPAPSRPRGRAPAPARTALERTVAAVWEEVLEREGIGADDHFFEIGGHSLLAVRVQRRLEERLGREVRVLDLFAHPTVAALAAHLERAPEEEGAAVIAGRGEKRRTFARRQGARRATSALSEERLDGEPD
ncbi:MAG TPA: phosphopantetheine-binding protein, partial [Longimicrobium sp.]|nr:phosphopantetheine-binding protein [Longimicrobium sp.]